MTPVRASRTPGGRDHRARRPSARRWRRLVGAALVVTALAIADGNGWLLVRRVPNDVDVYDGASARVVRVIDGDTLDIDVPDAARSTRLTRVRLWGVSCPKASSDDGAAEPGADRATAFASRRTRDVEVVLRLEPHRTRGPHGRLLAHVELGEGQSLNATLLAAGLATVDDRWPHARLRDYAHAEADAKRARRGLWAPSGEFAVDQ